MVEKEGEGRRGRDERYENIDKGLAIRWIDQSYGERTAHPPCLLLVNFSG